MQSQYPREERTKIVLVHTCPIYHTNIFSVIRKQYYYLWLQLCCPILQVSSLGRRFLRFRCEGWLSHLAGCCQGVCQCGRRSYNHIRQAGDWLWQSVGKDRWAHWFLVTMHWQATRFLFKAGSIDIWIGLTNPNLVSCKDAGCNGQLVWDDGTSYTFYSASTITRVPNQDFGAMQRLCPLSVLFQSFKVEITGVSPCIHYSSSSRILSDSLSCDQELEYRCDFQCGGRGNTVHGIVRLYVLDIKSVAT